MKAPRLNPSRTARENGSAVLILITLLAVMLLLLTANSSALLHLHRELKLLDQRQLERLKASQTNVVTSVLAPEAPDPK